MTARSTSSRTLDILHRGSSALIGLVLWAFAALGYANLLDFFSTTGTPLLGMSTNGLLSTISVVFGAVLLAAAVRGGRAASTTSVAVGALFLLSGVLHALILTTALNVLSFRIPNVVFSLVVGVVLLTLGAWGRFTGRLPDDNPYAQQARREDPELVGPDRDQRLPVDATDVAVTRELADAERAVAAGGGTDRERTVVADLAGSRDPADRRARWRRLGRSG